MIYEFPMKFPHTQNFSVLNVFKYLSEFDSNNY